MGNVILFVEEIRNAHCHSMYTRYIGKNREIWITSFTHATMQHTGANITWLENLKNLSLRQLLLNVAVCKCLLATTIWAINFTNIKTRFFKLKNPALNEQNASLVINKA